MHKPNYTIMYCGRWGTGTRKCVWQHEHFALISKSQSKWIADNIFTISLRTTCSDRHIARDCVDHNVCMIHSAHNADTHIIERVQATNPDYFNSMISVIFLANTILKSVNNISSKLVLWNNDVESMSVCHHHYAIIVCFSRTSFVGSTCWHWSIRWINMNVHILSKLYALLMRTLETAFFWV